jgi:hypothetical protein
MDDKKADIAVSKTPVENLQQGPAGVAFKLPNLPAMEAVGAVKTPMQTANLKPMTMDAPAAGTQGRMDAFRAGLPEVVRPAVLQAQQGSPLTHPVQPSDGYMRMEIHSENGQLSIVGAQSVDGPLAQPEKITTGLVYEATVDNQQVALGSLPDANISRAFANSDVPDYHGKHRVTLRTSYNFFVRIPKSQLTAVTMPKLNIVLHNVTSAPDLVKPGILLSQQTGILHQEVGRISGINLASLPVEIKPLLQNLLR